MNRAALGHKKKPTSYKSNPDIDPQCRSQFAREAAKVAKANPSILLRGLRGFA
jgi:hypothetical protein